MRYCLILILLLGGWGCCTKKVEHVECAPPVYYQPVVVVSDGATTGTEIISRPVTVVRQSATQPTTINTPSGPVTLPPCDIQGEGYIETRYIRIR